MSFANFLLEEGVEMELQSELRETLVALDSDVPTFSYSGCGFQVRPLGGVIGSKWRLQVQALEHSHGAQPSPTVGLIEMDKMANGGTLLRIPPQGEWADSEAKAFDKDGDFFTSFLFQLLNAFRGRGLIELPGRLPDY